MLPFQPKHRLGHPENYLFLIPEKLFIGSKYPKIVLFNFEKNFTVCEDQSLGFITTHPETSGPSVDRPGRYRIRVGWHKPAVGFSGFVLAETSGSSPRKVFILII